jgi:hypothetical protein
LIRFACRSGGRRYGILGRRKHIPAEVNDRFRSSCLRAARWLRRLAGNAQRAVLTSLSIRLCVRQSATERYCHMKESYTAAVGWTTHSG